MQMDGQNPLRSNCAVKRKISWSDNSNEPSRHSKVARTQVAVVDLELAAPSYKISCSDNGDDEPASHSEATLAQPRPSSALKQKPSWSDDGSDSEDSGDTNRTNDNHNGDLESLRGPLTRPGRRTDILWPEVPSRSRRCCQRCEAMTGTPEGLSALLSDGGYEHFNWYEIQETAALDCALCRAIWDGLEDEDWDYENDGSVTHEKIRIFANVTCQPPFVDGGLSEHPLEGIQLHSLAAKAPLDGGRPEADPASGFVPGRRESKELSPRAVDEIRRWLDKCFDKHPSCPQRCTPELPRRVLDVGTDSSLIRLHESQKGETAQYAALSYCWGRGVQHLTTTTSNLRDHMLALPNGLPQTISDAVEVCRKVGIRYLWVDALCIIQDSDTDKLDQITKMGSIYKSSTVTMVIASAETVTDGFLSNGIPEEPIAQLPISVDHSTSGTVYLRLQHTGKIYSSDEPIFHRAWTFQELLLSPRAIVFDSYQISLKCLKYGFRPVLKTYLDFEFSCLGFPVSVFGMVDESLAARESEDSKDYYLRYTQNSLWTRIIREYSQRDITLFDDRLPALAGIAAELAKSWNDVYLAGFWQKTIVQHLGWYRSEPTEQFGKPPRRVFEGVGCTKRIGSPSWSWVTVPYPVCVEETYLPDAKLVGSGVELGSQKSPFGQVKGAYIVLEARILKTSDLALKFECWSSLPSFNSILLDFENPKPELNNCRLIYLSEGMYARCGIFLAVEKCMCGEFRRVGFAKLNGGKKEWKDLLSVTKRETIVIK